MARKPGPAKAHAIRSSVLSACRTPRLAPNCPAGHGPIQLARSPSTGPGPQSPQPLQGGFALLATPQPASTATRPAGSTIRKRPGPAGPHRPPSRTAPSPDPGAPGQQATGVAGGHGPTADRAPAETPTPSMRRAAAVMPHSSPGSPVRAGKPTMAHPRLLNQTRPWPSVAVTGIRPYGAAAKSPLQRSKRPRFHSAAHPENLKKARPDRINAERRP
ncbi:hypothetical protein NDU88_003126 [Pleurodeles waltl]|uniref:Uncharacterized protein n=1 Tax=Pleurodeles waltl TaxID=8319 RepID=A0AAV7SCJ5_PLEWA|nr:hypothetical protein NDU88_003126 [Pleurodeles waltl]